MLDALKGVVHVDQRSLRRHAPGEGTDSRRRNLGQPGCPLRRLRTAIARAEHVALETVEPGAAAPEKPSVVEALGDEGVGEREHDRDVAARDDGEPLGGDELGQIAAQRAHQHELRAPGARRCYRICCGSWTRARTGFARSPWTAVTTPGTARPSTRCSEL